MNTFGEKLRTLRKRAGLSQVQLAKKLGTTKQSISRYETSAREPNIVIASRIADALGVPITDLVDDSVIEKTDPDAETVNQLFALLRPDEKKMIISQLQGLVLSHTTQDDQ